MAISKNSKRVQFTLNKDKEKEKQIAEFLDGCLNPNSTIKEIIYNYIVSNCNTKLPQVTQIEVTKSEVKLPEVTQSDNLNNNIVSNSEKKTHEVSELETNELEELNKFL